MSTTSVTRFLSDIKNDRAQAVKTSLLSNASLATVVHPTTGQTALQMAVQTASESVIRSLRRHGARWTDTDPAGNNAVHYVARAGRSDLCRTRKSADWVMALHQPNCAGDTPLHTALITDELTPGCEDVIKAFVAVGADIYRRNSSGKTSLDLAEARLDLIKLMKTSAEAALSRSAGPSQSESTSRKSKQEIEQHLPDDSMFDGGSFMNHPEPHTKYSTSFMADIDRAPLPSARQEPYAEPSKFAASATGESLRGSRRSSKSVFSSGRTGDHKPHSHSGGTRHLSREPGYRGSFSGEAGTAPSRAVSQQLEPWGACRGGAAGSAGVAPPPPIRVRQPSVYSPGTGDAGEDTPQSQRSTAARGGAESAAAYTGLGQASRPTSYSRPRGAVPVSRSTRSEMMEEDSHGHLDSPHSTTSRNRDPSHALDIDSSSSSFFNQKLTSSAFTKSSTLRPVNMPTIQPPRTTSSARTACRPLADTVLQTQVHEMQKALEKAASAMRQMQEDRATDATELANLTTCMGALTERMDILDKAIQQISVESIDAANSETSHRITDVEQLLTILQERTLDGEQWLQETRNKMEEFWAQFSQFADSVNTLDDTVKGLQSDVEVLQTSNIPPTPTEPPLTAAAQQQIHEVQSEVTQATHTVARVQADVADAQEEIAGVQENLTEVTSGLGVLTDRFAELHSTVQGHHTASSTRMDAMQQTVEQLQESVETVKQSGGGGELDTLTSCGSVSPRARLPIEILERFQDVIRKVDALEDRIDDVTLLGAKTGAFEAPGQSLALCSEPHTRCNGSGSSASPPRTPAASHGDCNVSTDIGSDSGLPPPGPQTKHGREIPAHRALLYNNIYSGPSQSLEFSELSGRVEAVQESLKGFSKTVKTLVSEVSELRSKNKELVQDVSRITSLAPPTGDADGDGYAHRQGYANQIREIQCVLSLLREVAMRADAARDDIEEGIAALEGQVNRIERTTQVLEHSVRNHDEKLASLTYSPGNNCAREGSYTLKSTVEFLEAKVSQVEVQYLGRLQQQKAKSEQQAAIIQGLIERVQALEARMDSQES